MAVAPALANSSAARHRHAPPAAGTAAALARIEAHTDQGQAIDPEAKVPWVNPDW
uniref:hypothetical protein n=1 Tax=Pseudomonas bharatica TaxID=2692112 RepID=UPI0035DD1C67